MSDIEAIVVGAVAVVFFGVLLGTIKGTSQVQKRKGSDPYVLATYHVNHEMRVRRLMGNTSTQTNDAIELEALLRLDIEERVASLLALLTERGST